MNKIWLWALLVSSLMIYSNVYAEDFPLVGTDEMKKLVDKNTKMVIVDAREASEFKDGHIPKSVNVPPDKVSQIQGFLPKNKNIKIVIYCRGYS